LQAIPTGIGDKVGCFYGVPKLKISGDEFSADSDNCIASGYPSGVIRITVV
jgi:hypothetical protein